MYEISWPNLCMLSACIPSYDDEETDGSTVKKEKPEAKQAFPERIRSAEEMKLFYNF